MSTTAVHVIVAEVEFIAQRIAECVQNERNKYARVQVRHTSSTSQLVDCEMVVCVILVLEIGS